MEFDDIRLQLERYRQEGRRYFTTSSFQSHSLVLLHMLSKIDPDIAVYFINTGYHFPETVRFRDEIVDRFGLRNLVDLRSETPKSMQKDALGRLLPGRFGPGVGFRVRFTRWAARTVRGLL